MNNFLNNYQLKITNFERNLHRFMKEEYFPTLAESMNYSLMAGGKRLRPILMFETGRIFECNQDDLENFAVAIEMIHTYSLIHDDLPCMDDDALRRGMPTNHKVYGDANALLAGDGLLSLAFEVMADGVELVGKKGLKAMKYIAKMAGPSGMISGQCADIHFEKVSEDERTDEDLLYIHRRKTGGLITASIVAGAIIADASEENIEILEEFGTALGVLFQLTDDILDVEGDEKLLGKTTGQDQARNKFTFVSAMGLEKAKAEVPKLVCECKEIISKVKGKKGFFMDLVDNIATRVV
ncbi:MAG: farnesyl diphosphate synthase [Bacillota bacterium]